MVWGWVGVGRETRGRGGNGQVGGRRTAGRCGTAGWCCKPPIRPPPQSVTQLHCHHGHTHTHTTSLAAPVSKRRKRSPMASRLLEVRSSRAGSPSAVTLMAAGTRDGRGAERAQAQAQAVSWRSGGPPSLFRPCWAPFPSWHHLPLPPKITLLTLLLHPTHPAPPCPTRPPSSQPTPAHPPHLQSPAPLRCAPPQSTLGRRSCGCRTPSRSHTRKCAPALRHRTRGSMGAGAAGAWGAAGHSSAATEAAAAGLGQEGGGAACTCGQSSGGRSAGAGFPPESCGACRLAGPSSCSTSSSAGHQAHPTPLHYRSMTMQLFSSRRRLYLSPPHSHNLKRGAMPCANHRPSTSQPPPYCTHTHRYACSRRVSACHPGLGGMEESCASQHALRPQPAAGGTGHAAEQFIHHAAAARARHARPTRLPHNPGWP